jgi:glycolate oxidase FAD binding subunit
VEAPRESSTDDFTPTTAQELARFVAENARGTRRAVYPAGGRTARLYGYPPAREGVTVATGELNRVVDYPSRDMTITVEAGLRVETLQDLLKADGQRLAVDVAQAHRATLGGAIATNTSGPGRFGNGTFRDYVIGISAVDGQGRLFSAGGRVVKNVAGYDLCKLLVGSLGSLAIITQVTLKLRPRPETRRLVWATFDKMPTIDEALQALLTSQTRPAALEVLNSKAAWQLQSELHAPLPAGRSVLCVAFEGTDRETAWQDQVLRQELATYRPQDLVTVEEEAADKLWSALVEYQATSDDPVTFQATLPPSSVLELVSAASETDIAVQAHAGNGIIIGHLNDRCATAEEAAAQVAPLRALAERHAGALVILHCDHAWKSGLPVFGKERRDWSLMRRVKVALDPHGLLNPGRLWPAGG